MGAKSSKSPPLGTASGPLIVKVLEDAICRRLSGEDLSDEAVIAAHPDLMPDLGEMLGELRQVEAARRRVENSSNQWASATLLGRKPMPDSTAEALTHLPGYEIRREIHRGGQGVVYQAVQKSTRRDVAIKVMREGPISAEQDRGRFQREVEILAQLQHPHIVAIHDSGTIADQFYFVMDYVEGVPLDAFVESRLRGVRRTRGPHAEAFNIRSLLILFHQICDAIHAAHLRGVIHRDIKPSNILVDAAGEPRILDFGLAKLADDAAASDMTVAGQFIGSMPWCSPEQAEGRPDKIDMRSDVYSLGVVLYQMLTGKFPSDITGAARDVLARIQRVDPVAPSRLSSNIYDEVESITLKCLNKERDRRYQTAGELARDIERYLNGEPIEAKRDSGWYVLRKTLRRYRVQTAVAAAFFILTVGSAIALGVLYGDQKTQRIRAEDAEDLAEVRLGEISNALAKANVEARKAETTSAFLRDMLASVDPNIAQGRDVTVREVLDAAASKVDIQLRDEPAVAADVHRTLGKTYQGLARFADAEAQFRSALEISRRASGEEHPDTLEAKNGVATALGSLNKYDEAEALFRSCLESARRVLGPEHPQTLDYLSNLASLMRDRGRMEEAETLLKEAMEISTHVLGAEHPDTLVTRKVLAGLWQDQARFDLAEPVLRDVLDIQRRVEGPHAPNTIGTMQNLAMVLKAMGRLDEAAPMYEELVAASREVFGTDHSETLRVMNSLGRLKAAQGKLTEAEEIYRRTLEAQTRTLSEKHLDTLYTTNNLALLLSEQGRLAEAEPLARKALENGAAVLGEDHQDTLIWMNNLANLLSRQGRAAEAEALYRKVLEGRRRVLTDEHPQTLTTMSSLANQLADRGAVDEAEALLRQALAVRQRISGPTHADTLLAMSNLVKVLLLRGQAEEAERLGQQALEASRGTLGPGHPLTLLIANNAAKAMAAHGHAGEAETLLVDSLAQAAKSLPPGHVHRFYLHASLGGILLDGKRLDDAEQHLTTALTGLETSLGPRNANTLKTIEKLAALYDTMGDSTRADELRARLTAAEQPAPSTPLKE